MFNPSAVTSSASIGERRAELAEQTYRSIIPLMIKRVKLPSDIAQYDICLTKIDGTANPLAAAA
jgi:hypothetical protein